MSGLTSKAAVEPVVPRTALHVEVVWVDLRRVVDHVLGDRGAHDTPSSLVQELARDRMLALEDVSVLDDRAVVALVDDVSELLVVAGDDVLPVHYEPPRLLVLPASRVPNRGMRYARTVV